MGSLTSCKYIESYELLDENNNHVFGGFFGVGDTDIDYLYGCGSKKDPIASRVFFGEIFRIYKNRNFKKIFLGGGVTEDDDLSKFKRSIGGISHKCTTIRGITDKKKF